LRGNSRKSSKKSDGVLTLLRARRSVSRGSARGLRSRLTKRRLLYSAWLAYSSQMSSAL
jgi:hypothetical protein